MQMSSPQKSVSLPRSTYPVFVVGCHRSGTNLLYDTLLSAGGFAIYRGYLPVHKMLMPRFGNPSNRENRRHIVEAWMRSKGFRRSGLEAAALSQKLLAEASNGGDFIRIVMEQIANNQNAQRWAVYDPDNVLYMDRIKKEIPNALFLHIIRDGRDIALSLRKMGEFRPLPWNRKPGSLEATALYWEWMVKKGRQHGREIPEDYAEIHYEQLVQDPARAIAKLSTFLDQNLDHEHISAVRLGRLRDSNSSYKENEAEKASPVNRWKQSLSVEQVSRLEALIGGCLRECGYELVSPEAQRKHSLRNGLMRAVFPAFLEAKWWLKVRTPAGRFSDLSALEVSDTTADDGEKVTPAF